MPFSTSVPQRDLAVAGHHHFVVAADAEHRRRPYLLFHCAPEFYFIAARPDVTAATSTRKQLESHRFSPSRQHAARCPRAAHTQVRHGDPPVDVGGQVARRSPGPAAPARSTNWMPHSPNSAAASHQSSFMLTRKMRAHQRLAERHEQFQFLLRVERGWWRARRGSSSRRWAAWPPAASTG